MKELTEIESLMTKNLSKGGGDGLRDHMKSCLENEWGREPIFLLVDAEESRRGDLSKVDWIDYARESRIIIELDLAGPEVRAGVRNGYASVNGLCWDGDDIKLFMVSVPVNCDYEQPFVRTGYKTVEAIFKKDYFFA